MQYQSTAAPAAGGGRPGGVLHELWQHRILFFSVFVLVNACVIRLLEVLPVSYQAIGSVAVADEQPVAGLSSEASIQKVGDPADLESQLLMARSPRLLRELIAWPEAARRIQEDCRSATTHSLLRGWGQAGDRCARLLPGSDAAMAWVQKRFSVGVVGRSRVIAIAYNSASPETARFLANALVNSYLGDSRLQKLRSRDSALAWVRQQLTALTQQMADDDRQIEIYRHDHGLLRGQMAPVSSERLSMLGQQLAAAQAAQAAAAAQIKEGDGSGRHDDAVADAVLGSATISQAKQMLVKTEADLAGVAQNAGTGNPVLRALTAQRDTLRGRIASETQQIASGLRRNYEVANEQVSDLTLQMHAAEAEVSEASAAEAAVAGLTRQADRKRAQFADLSKDANLLETESRVMTGDVQLVNLAELPVAPVFPKKLPFTAAGMVLALTLASLAALLRARSDDSIHSVRGVEEAVGLRTIGQIPALFGEFWQSPRRSTMLGDPTPREALRALLSQVERLTPANPSRGRPRRSLLITSTRSGEGRSTLAVGLALMAAASGKRTLVIECNLSEAGQASPDAGSAGAVGEVPGLVHYMSGDAGFLEIVTPGPMAGLDIISGCGNRPSRPAVLTSTRMALLLQHAADYDLVLLDGPCLEHGADVSILSRQADGTLYCARWGTASTGAVAGGVRAIGALGAHVLGIVLTGMPDGMLRSNRLLPPAQKQLQLEHAA